MMLAWPRQPGCVGDAWRRLVKAGGRGGAGVLEPPIRAELLGSAGFIACGRRLALAHGAVDPARRASVFFPRLRQNIPVLQQAHRRSRHNLPMLSAIRPITAARSGWRWRKPSA